MIFTNLIQTNLNTSFIGRNIEYYSYTDSTNDDEESEEMEFPANTKFESVLSDAAEQIGFESGNVVSWSSAGAKGFNGSRKSTPYAAQVAADDAGAKNVVITLNECTYPDQLLFVRTFCDSGEASDNSSNFIRLELQ